jgi:hypothetical protein
VDAVFNSKLGQYDSLDLFLAFIFNWNQRDPRVLRFPSDMIAVPANDAIFLPNHKCERIISNTDILIHLCNYYRGCYFQSWKILGDTYTALKQ